MSARRTSYGKVARERDKKAKAAAKREQRQSRGAPEESDAPAPPAPAGPELTTAELLQMVEDLHKRFDAGLVSYDEYEEQKADLLSRIKLD
ncbi:MAG TPA: hypothetical protein VM263_10760 [Acidimicrobiales bacterium]|nr:hypothetical protein [Acidimicrobiales bacterium]HVM03138.1 hypothetical protein [Acidimicrobiales bacterium]